MPDQRRGVRGARCDEADGRAEAVLQELAETEGGGLGGKAVAAGRGRRREAAAIGFSVLVLGIAIE